KKADELKGSKVAIKIISPDVVHKSDQGAVKVNIEGKDAILAAYDEMAKHLEKTIPSVHIEGVLLQPMIKGKEVIVGMKRDSVFGPTIVFGMGGVFVEVFKDVSMRVPPIDKEMAKNMINEIKGSAILRGMRGEKSVNIDALAKIIVSIAKMSVEHPEIQELDLNPVIINEKDAYVVDVRVMK
ncbi:MAG: acetate--CoA ligase family protein, partial [Candidatus Pacebacteria bacterium]|nr:acetate--CoA ligase family protein [Candidatus Paceibacterota bacterium]